MIVATPVTPDGRSAAAADYIVAAKTAQVVQLRATHVTATLDLDLLDDRAVQREGTLDADAEAHLAHGEGLLHAARVAGDDDACEHLDARARAFGDVHVHLDGVTGREDGDVAAEGCRVDGVEDLHDRHFLRPPQVDRES